MVSKLRLLVISAVKPYPGQAGQQVRVCNKLTALHSFFEITFLTVVPPSQVKETAQQLQAFVDKAIVLPSVSQRHLLTRLLYKLLSGLYTLRTGLKASNYLLGQVDLSPARVAAACKAEVFDLVLYEYWHTHPTLKLFQRSGIPCVLDMHDVLWQSYERQLSTHPLPWMRWLRTRLTAAYQRQEEVAWAKYDGLIAISQGEADYVRQVLPAQTLFVAPMGTDLTQWPYQWQPEQPPRLAFYGSLGSRVNQESVQWCVTRIMPLVWQQVPTAEFWIVGANPPPAIQALAQDERIQVTGFVPDVAEVLATMTAVLCPWEGTYGFRSRLIEVMALGVPVVATPDAVYGMGLTEGKGIFLQERDELLAASCVQLICQPDWARQQSRCARQQVEKKYSFAVTYDYLAQKLYTLAGVYQSQQQ